MLSDQEDTEPALTWILIFHEQIRIAQSELKLLMETPQSEVTDLIWSNHSHQIKMGEIDNTNRKILVPYSSCKC